MRRGGIFIEPSEKYTFFWPRPSTALPTVEHGPRLCKEKLFEKRSSILIERICYYRRATTPSLHGQAHVLAGYAMISGLSGDLEYGIKQVNTAISLYDLCGDAGNLERMNIVKGLICNRDGIATSIISTV